MVIHRDRLSDRTASIGFGLMSLSALMADKSLFLFISRVYIPCGRWTTGEMIRAFTQTLTFIAQGPITRYAACSTSLQTPPEAFG